MFSGLNLDSESSSDSDSGPIYKYNSDALYSEDDEESSYNSDAEKDTLFIPQAAEAVNSYWISLYLDTPSSRVSRPSFLCFSKPTDLSYRHRTEAYMKLLESQACNFVKMVLIYALFCNTEAKELQNRVVQAMGCTSIRQAKRKIRKAMECEVSHYKYKEGLMETVIDKECVPAITQAANKNRPFDVNHYVMPIRKLRAYAHFARLLLPDLPPLSVNPDSEYFVAIAKVFLKITAIHTFILLGVRDKETGENHILCGVGKVNIHSRCGGPIRIKGEDFLFKDVEKKISYKAFSISPENYQEFLAFISSYTEKSEMPIPAYQSEQPLEKDTAMTYKFEFVPSDENPEALQGAFAEVYKGADSLSCTDSCRKTGIDFLKAIFDNHFSRKGISTNCLKDFPFSTTTRKGKLSGDLFILPLLPDSDDPNYAMLSKMYKQLERIPNKYRNNELTFQKFELLKKIYMDIQGPSRVSIGKIFEMIHNWDDLHREQIDTKRGFFSYSKTHTRYMLDDLYKIEKKPGNG